MLAALCALGGAPTHHLAETTMLNMMARRRTISPTQNHARNRRDRMAIACHQSSLTLMVAMERPPSFKSLNDAQP